MSEVMSSLLLFVVVVVVVFLLIIPFYLVSLQYDFIDALFGSPSSIHLLFVLRILDDWG